MGRVKEKDKRRMQEEEAALLEAAEFFQTRNWSFMWKDNSPVTVTVPVVKIPKRKLFNEEQWQFLRPTIWREA